MATGWKPPAPCRSRRTSARPDLANSRLVTNAGPAIYEVTHYSGQCRLPTNRLWSRPASTIPDGVQTLTLNYRLDPAADYTSVTMRDDGTGGDAIAGDGLFSATIPGQSANTIAAFYIAATDRKGAATRFPALAQRQRAGARVRRDVRRRQSGRKFRSLSLVDYPDERHALEPACPI